jgi:hypothetical protein
VDNQGYIELIELTNVDESESNLDKLSITNDEPSVGPKHSTNHFSRHQHEVGQPMSASRKYVRRKYLALRIIATKESSFCKICHSTLALPPSTC